LAQARRIFDRFGGVRALHAALKRLGPEHEREISALYRWGYPVAAGGAGGAIPTAALRSVRLAARLEGIFLTPEDLIGDLEPIELPALPPVAFSPVPVEPRPVAEDVLERVFRSYALAIPNRWKVLYEALSQQQRLVDLAVALLGRGPENAKLLEATGGALRVLRIWTALQKVAGVAERVRRELAAGAYASIVLFAAHHDVLTELGRAMADMDPLRVYTSTPPDRRRVIADKRAPVLLCQIEAATAGVWLATREALFVDADWSVARNAQAVMRLRGAGPVRARFAKLARSSDQVVQRVLFQGTRSTIG